MNQLDRKVRSALKAKKKDLEATMKRTDRELQAVDNAMKFYQPAPPKQTRRRRTK